MSDPFAAQLSAFKKSLKSSTDLPQQRRILTNTSSQSTTSQTNKSLKRPESSDSSDSLSKRLKSNIDSDDENNINNENNSTLNSNISKNNNNENNNNNNTTNLLNKPPTTIAEVTKLTAAAQAAAASGQDNLTMKLMSSSDYIRSKDREVPIFEIETSLGFKVDNQLLKCLSNVDRIQYNPETLSFQYLSLHNIKTGEDLLRVLRNQPAYAGLSVKQLKDGWNNCLPTINKLEKENEIIVHKTKKDNSPRHIWLNFDKLPIRVYNGVQNIQNWEIITGQIPSLPQNSENLNKPAKSLDMIFYEMWNAVPIPQHDDLVKLLIDNGLKPTNAEPESMKSKKITSVKERKQKKTRRSKITNLHMKGILKDYSGKFK